MVWFGEDCGGVWRFAPRDCGCSASCALMLLALGLSVLLGQVFRSYFFIEYINAGLVPG